MQNIMIAYYEKLNGAGVKTQDLRDIFKDSNLHVSDYLIIVYLFLFLIWIANFAKHLFITIKSVYKRDSLLAELHRATYHNDTLSALKLCKAFPEGINKFLEKDGFTPFLRACYHGNTQLVKCMLELGADINSKTSRGENGMYLAVYNRIKNRKCRDASCIHALYHSGIDINAVNGNNFTVLQLAAMFGHTSLVRWLLTKNANINVYPGPYCLARSAGHLETMHLLRDLHILSE